MPFARGTDPQTSHDAANSIADVTPLQERILQCFDTYGAMADEELIRQYKRTYGIHWPAADSSIRSRRKELVDKGKLLPTFSRAMTNAGRQSIVWDREMVLL